MAGRWRAGMILLLHQFPDEIDEIQSTFGGKHLTPLIFIAHHHFYSRQIIENWVIFFAEGDYSFSVSSGN